MLVAERPMAVFPAPDSHRARELRGIGPTAPLDPLYACRVAPHRPLPRTGWDASGGKRTAIHSEGGCYSMTSSARPRIAGGIRRRAEVSS
jgi:hypothetical protein